MDKVAQGAFEFMLMLAAVVMLVGVVVSLVWLTTYGLGSSVGGQIYNLRDNITIPVLVGMVISLGSRLWCAQTPIDW